MSQVKRFAFMPRKQGTSEAFFHEHWRTVHREHALRITLLQRYVQLHRVAGDVPGFAPSIYDGVAEVWIESLAAAASQATDPDYTNYAAKDEEVFLDVERLTGVLSTQEQVVVAGPGLERDSAGATAMIMLRRRPDVSPSGFASWWDSELGGLVRRAVPSASRQVQSLSWRDPAGGDEPVFDGVLELWWEDAAAYAGAAAELERLAADLGDAPVDLAASASMRGEELRVIWPEEA